MIRPRNLDGMRDEEVTHLSESYPSTARPEEAGLLRVAGPLGLNLATSVALGDEIIGDLDSVSYGIGWWKAYPDLDRQTRILLSDYLVACARAITTWWKHRSSASNWTTPSKTSANG